MDAQTWNGNSALHGNIQLTKGFRKYGTAMTLLRLKNIEKNQLM